MTYCSRVGYWTEVFSPIKDILDQYFSFLERDVRGFYEKNTHLDGFCFPQHEYVSSRADLFARYGLYINRKGINTPGDQIDPLKEMDMGDFSLLTTSSPLFVGDRLKNGTPILFAQGEYCAGRQIWNISVIKGISLPQPLPGTDSHPFHEECIKAIQDLTQSLVDLLKKGVIVGTHVMWMEKNPIPNIDSSDSERSAWDILKKMDPTTRVHTGIQTLETEVAKMIQKLKDVQT